MKDKNVTTTTTKQKTSGKGAAMYKAVAQDVEASGVDVIKPTNTESGDGVRQGAAGSLGLVYSSVSMAILLLLWCFMGKNCWNINNDSNNHAFQPQVEQKYSLANPEADHPWTTTMLGGDLSLDGQGGGNDQYHPPQQHGHHSDWHRPSESDSRDEWDPKDGGQKRHHHGDDRMHPHDYPVPPYPDDERHRSKGHHGEKHADHPSQKGRDGKHHPGHKSHKGHDGKHHPDHPSHKGHHGKDYPYPPHHGKEHDGKKKHHSPDYPFAEEAEEMKAWEPLHPPLGPHPPPPPHHERDSSHVEEYTASASEDYEWENLDDSEDPSQDDEWEDSEDDDDDVDLD